MQAAIAHFGAPKLELRTTAGGLREECAAFSAATAHVRMLCLALNSRGPTMRTDRNLQRPDRGKPGLRGLVVSEASDQLEDEQSLAAASAGAPAVVLLVSSHGNGDWFQVFPGIGQPPVPIAGIRHAGPRLDGRGHRRGSLQVTIPLPPGDWPGGRRQVPQVRSGQGNRSGQPEVRGSPALVPTVTGGWRRSSWGAGQRS